MEYRVHHSLRHAVWTEMYTIECASRYFEELLKRHRRWNWCFHGGSVLAALSAIVVNALDMPVAFKILSFVPFFGAILLEAKMDLARLDSIRNIRKACYTVASTLEKLWNDVETCANAQSEQVIELDLSQVKKIKDILIDSQFLDSDLTEDRKLNEKCSAEAQRFMLNFYEGAHI